MYICACTGIAVQKNNINTRAHNCKHTQNETYACERSLLMHSLYHCMHTLFKHVMSSSLYLLNWLDL